MSHDISAPTFAVAKNHIYASKSTHHCGQRPGVLRHKQAWSWPGGGGNHRCYATTSHSLGNTQHTYGPQKESVFHVFGGFLLHIFAYEILVYGLPTLLELLETDVQANTKCLISIMPFWVVNCLIFMFQQDQQDSNLNAHGHLALHHLASCSLKKKLTIHKKDLFSIHAISSLIRRKYVQGNKLYLPIPPLPQGTWAWWTRQKRTFWRNIYIYISATIFWPCLRFW